jgi:succinate-acetate transporter protein
MTAPASHDERRFALSADRGAASSATSYQVFLRPLGTPMPLGLFGLAAASLVTSGLELGWVPPAQRPLVGVVLVAFPVALQLLAAILSLFARDAVAGSGLGVLSTTWLALGAVYVITPPSSTSAAVGLLLLASSTALLLSGISASSTKLLPAAVFALSGARFALAGAHQLGAGGAWQGAAGAVGLALTALAFYTAFALELESTLGRSVLPVLRRGPGEPVGGASLEEQLEGLPREPGVRKAL